LIDYAKEAAGDQLDDIEDEDERLEKTV